jgi:hypothetical protein
MRSEDIGLPFRFDTTTIPALLSKRKGYLPVSERSPTLVVTIALTSVELTKTRHRDSRVCTARVLTDCVVFVEDALVCAVQLRRPQ